MNRIPTPEDAIIHYKVVDQAALPKTIRSPRHDFLIVPNFSTRAPDDTSPAYLRKATLKETRTISARIRTAVAKDAAAFGAPLTEEQQQVATYTKLTSVCNF